MSERNSPGNPGAGSGVAPDPSGLTGFSNTPSASGMTARPTSLTGVTDTGPDPSATGSGSGVSSGSGGSGGSGTGQGTKESVKEAAQETKDAAMETAQQIKGDVRAQATEVVGEAKQQATQLMGQAKEQASSAFSQQQQQAVSGLGSLSEALRQTAKHLKDGGDGAQAGIGQFVEDAADRLAQSADFLRDKEPAQLLHDVQDFARKQPMLFVGAAFGIGLFAARMMKGAGGGAVDQAMGSLSEQATQAMDAVKGRVSDMTGSSSGSGQSGQSGQSRGSEASSAPWTGSSASSAASSGRGGLNETAADAEIERAHGQTGSWNTDLAGDTAYRASGVSSGATAGYAPDAPAEGGRS